MGSVSNQVYSQQLDMLDVSSAKHILQLACGTGKMIPLTVALKRHDATYLATDVSKVMAEISKRNIGNYLQRTGAAESVEEWMDTNKVAG